MRHDESLRLIGIAALSILADMKEGKNIKLNVYQLSKYSKVDRRLIYYHYKNIRNLKDV